MKRSLIHVAGLVFNQPHAITPEKLQVIRDVVVAKIHRGPMAFDFDDEGGMPDEADARYPVTADGIAIIGVEGTLVRRATGMAAISGLRSYAAIQSDIQSAMEDGAVKGVILRVDSGGGECSGCFDLSDYIGSLKGKPIYSVADDSMFSAAYAIGSAASKVYISRTSGVGSIGVIAAHCDMSASDEKEGMKYTLVTYGKYKADGNPHEPLTVHALATLSAEVDRLGDMFVASVANNRKMDPAAIKAMEAGCYFGESAIAAGLADKMGGMDAALEDMRAELGLTPGEDVDESTAGGEGISFSKADRSLFEATMVSGLNISPGAAKAIERRAVQNSSQRHAPMAFAIRAMNPAMLATGEGGKRTIEGCPVPYGVLSRDIGGFKEIYAPGCFTESIREDDILALFNHNADHVLGRNSSGTLAISEDSKGVHFSISPPSKDWAEALVESMQRGDIDGMSAAFYITQYHWEMRDGWKVRVIEKARMVESSVATFPYFKTSAAANTPAANQVSSHLQRKLNRARLESAKFQ